MKNELKLNKFYFAPYDGVDEGNYYVMMQDGSDATGIVGGLGSGEAKAACDILNAAWNARAGGEGEPVGWEEAGGLYGEPITVQEFNGCFRQAIKALEYIGRYGRPATGGEQFPNSECCQDIANQLKRVMEKGKPYRHRTPAIDAGEVERLVYAYERAVIIRENGGIGGSARASIARAALLEYVSKGGKP